MIRKNTKTGIKISEIKLLVLIIFSGTVLIAHSVSSHALQELMSLQANVEQSGTALQSGNVIVTIWDALTGGNLIYNSTTDFYNAISNGKFDIVLGNSTNSLNLEYGKVYYTDFEINGSDVDFKGLERQIFQSSVGNISTEDIRDRSINPADLNDTAAYLFNRIALGGISSQAYNAFSDSKTAAFASTDNDLFIEDILEV
ncbi:hypothetical protein HYU06_01165, partial [Candidatus Woesearchaeota archaeon]|nr:hypothetical protein [Candidatus Woesearchaeota archaeon]